jgi:threonylcarbamoyladenosine tRNA methylthiotransferase MtaB
MPGQLPNDVKQERSRQAIRVAEEMKKNYLQQMVSNTFPVLFEEPEDGYFTGHTPNYIKVYVNGNALHNMIKNVTLTGLFRDGMLGILED